ncbi:hypothetical protein GmRootA79_49590 [Acidovorax sp. A79]|uniref:helix-turn-helix transcriptional regulator n=1 Tax=Acidovorax sp. A79 TaxID=3056107 RepID=UPI0034E85B98
MQDFASAAMVRLLVRAMHAHGLAPPPAPHGLHGGPQGSRVPLACKRAVVEAILRQGGPAMLLRLAQRVDLLQGDPVHRALMGAADMAALLARWQRLERYVHSRHQVSVQALGPGRLQLRHHARAGVAQPPLPTESLAVLGVLLGAGKALGVRALGVEMAASRLRWDADDRRGGGLDGDLDGRLAQLMAHGKVDQWVLHWQASGARAPEAPPPSAATGLCDPLPWPPLAHALARHVLQDPAAPHTVDALARQAGLARRSLQRALSGTGLSCRSIVAEARARAAAQWLLQERHGLAEIGFACGFADQPHFTREFARHVGLTPARYRQAFGEPVQTPR